MMERKPVIVPLNQVDFNRVTLSAVLIKFLLPNRTLHMCVFAKIFSLTHSVSLSLFDDLTVYSDSLTQSV
jgi:hypothetical protein